MSSEWDALDQAEEVRSSAEDSVESDVDDYQAAAERHSEETHGAEAGAVDDAQTGADRLDEDEILAECRFCDAEFSVRSAERVHSCPGRDQLAGADQDGLFPVVCPNTHELRIQSLFAEHGIEPFWQLRRTFDDDPTAVADDVDGFEFDGDKWVVNHETTKCWRDGWAIPDAQRDYATASDLEDGRFLEFQFALVAVDDVGEKEAVFTVRPGFPEPRKPDGSRARGFPADHPKGVRVESNSSNLHPRQVYQLLQRFVAELGLDPEPFGLEAVHEWSRCTQLARYLRVTRELSEQHIVGSGGLIERLSQLAPRLGGKGAHIWDDEDVTGHYESIAMDAPGWLKLIPDSTHSKRLKSYHPLNARSADTSADEDELRDPKIELQHASPSLLDDETPWEGSDPVPVRSDQEFDLFDLVDEIDSTLYNFLEWAGLPTRADEDVFTADPYFPVEEEQRDVDFVADPTQEIENAERDLVRQHVSSGDHSESERAVLADLVDSPDGKHWEQIRESVDVSKSTIYRAARAFPDLLNLENGRLSLEDRAVRDQLRGALSVFDDVADWVRGQVTSLETAVDDSRLEDTPLLSWARRHGVDVDRGQDGFTFRIDGRRLSWYDLWTMMRDGFDAAEATGSHTARELAKTATVVYRNVDGHRVSDDNFVRHDGTQDKVVISGAPYKALR
ncbi:DUF7845 domain-containing protein [Halolamina salifodinae]|uniref:DUF7845 domain-containing protein n=1 Tax=Halolamina salifodinae TaxID=1202767 RepID=A0A8T4GYN5_9EURY|nr:hypothetical protein [Halolamina salifodinae]MBP1987253.1 hypothetical protein [Halolamina salifodinae]